MQSAIACALISARPRDAAAQTYLQNFIGLTYKQIANVTPYTSVNGVLRGPFMDSTFFFNRIGTPLFNVTAAFGQRGWSADDWTSIATAINYVEADTGILVIASQKAISTTDTMRATCALQVNRGGLITIASTKNLLIQNGPYAGPYQIFAGSGTVTIDSGAIEQIYPEWWGALPNDATNDATALNAAITACRKGMTIQLGAGTYLLSSTIALNKRGMRLCGIGNGTVILVNSSSIHGVTVTAADVVIENLWMRGYDGKSSTGAGIFFDDGSSNGIVNNVKIDRCGVAIEEDISSDTENNLFVGNDLRSNQYDLILRYLSYTKVSANLR